jgi:hypothetical protein
MAIEAGNTVISEKEMMSIQRKSQEKDPENPTRK